MEIIRSVRLTILGTLLAAMLLVSVSSFAGVFVSVGFGPPALPVYVQPPCPALGFIWTPGYWGYGPDGYFWVPGTWVTAPQPGLLWTPGYWGWGGAAFMWHAGYWGPTIGFYGGINYGFGYGGVGYQGGYWRNGAFFYNRSVNNVTSIHVTNVYNTRVVENVNHVSFNGGEGGLAARPTPAEERAVGERHFEPTALQTRHETAAASNRQMLASENHGRPAIAATAKPGEFSGRGVVAAKEAGAPYKAPANRGASEPRANNVPRPGNNAAHPASADRSAAPAHNSVPRPPQRAGSASPARVENTSRSSAVPRPTSTPHASTAPRSEPRAESAPRTAAPHSSAAARPESTKRPQAESRAEPRSEPREEGHPKGRR